MTRAVTMNSDALTVLNTARSLPLLAVVSIKFAACVTKWVTRRQTRLALDQLEAWQLDDLGLTPAAAYDEARKVFWKA
ncbi:uncharacterized protein YjiS (DUF1127 family) [Sulfitobacter undariae]|uniref:Uncharacterized protein YjiS (DUF1127 family) n=1 Tax=Sulfitobacter undariae TaxID=1563671 RepID=A0A7W6EB58_9RHOB|nr:DUF1127 domain-containing protein [Sulfitobacter undariae]MBB3994544.1 uncharacterized protein YjiS (DUF1127 family) [Sulfitobacter undariae]